MNREEELIESEYAKRLFSSHVSGPPRWQIILEASIECFLHHAIAEPIQDRLHLRLAIAAAISRPLIIIGCHLQFSEGSACKVVVPRRPPNPDHRTRSTSSLADATHLTLCRVLKTVPLAGRYLLIAHSFMLYSSLLIYRCGKHYLIFFP